MAVIALVPFVLFLELIAGAVLGEVIICRTTFSRRVRISVIATLLLMASVAYLSTIFPGPSDRYGPGSPTDLIRDFVIGPMSFTWFLAPTLGSCLVSLYRRPKFQVVPRSIDFARAALSSLISVALVPVWIVGGSIHMAYYAGGWF